jgi:phosphoribosylformylglycinamidine cyclo-ligase
MMVARDTGIWNTVGIDCVAMNVNDLYAIGAEPVAMVDYIALNQPEPEVLALIGEGLNRGAELANITIVGGETAALPEIVYDMDLAGTAVGFVDRKRLISGEGISYGDSVIALPSTGLHSNGYTLARRVLEVSGYQYGHEFPYARGRSIGEVFLEPTRIYSEIPALIEKHLVRGLIHVTGGGLLNFRRLTQYGLNLHTLPESPPVFRFLQEEGGISTEEMYRTFNMGIGFLIIARSSSAEAIAKDAGGMIIGNVTSEPGCRIGELRLW